MSSLFKNRTAGPQVQHHVSSDRGVRMLIVSLYVYKQVFTRFGPNLGSEVQYLTQKGWRLYASCTVSNMFTLVRLEVSSSFLQGSVS